MPHWSATLHTDMSNNGALNTTILQYILPPKPQTWMEASCGIWNSQRSVCSLYDTARVPRTHVYLVYESATTGLNGMWCRSSSTVLQSCSLVSAKAGGIALPLYLPVAKWAVPYRRQSWANRCTTCKDWQRLEKNSESPARRKESEKWRCRIIKQRPRER